MAFPRRPLLSAPVGAPGPRGRSGGVVLAVGRRVLVSCPPDGPRRVALTDPTGTSTLGSVADGAEVEILGWIPRGAGGPRYRVRASGERVEGWLSAANLRPPPTPPPVPVVRPPAPPAPVAARPAPRKPAKAPATKPARPRR